MLAAAGVKSYATPEGNAPLRLPEQYGTSDAQRVAPEKAALPSPPAAARTAGHLYTRPSNSRRLTWGTNWRARASSSTESTFVMG